jgi:hypothetical protein
MAQAAEATMAPEPEQENPDGRTHEQILEAVRSELMGFVDGLQRTANNQVLKKQLIEDRWVEDLRQYHGRYDADTEKNLNNDKTKSRLFVNKTRTKTHGWEARLSDLLFPTDVRNWAISATPVPELSRQAAKAQQGAMLSAERANNAMVTGDMASVAQHVDQGTELAQQVAQARGHHPGGAGARRTDGGGNWRPVCPMSL